jgi:hypothetical protein
MYVYEFKYYVDFKLSEYEKSHLEKTFSDFSLEFIPGLGTDGLLIYHLRGTLFQLQSYLDWWGFVYYGLERID